MYDIDSLHEDEFQRSIFSDRLGAVAAGVLPLTQKGQRVKPPKNGVFCIVPTRNRAGIWAFTDKKAGLEDEPFVGEINDMIDHLVKDISGAKNGFALFFSDKPIKDFQMSFTLQESGIAFENEVGATYTCDQLNIDGWLCPALFCYFEAPPKKLYVRAEKARK
jgi:hypothetical protein